MKYTWITRFFTTMIFGVILSLSVLLFFYGWLILKFRNGWLRIPEINTTHQLARRVFVSVVVAFRNEEKNLEEFIYNLGQLRFSFHMLELVMVDDHSTDSGLKLLERMQTQRPWMRIFRARGEGKKAVLREGVSKATGELIVTTDVDCRFGKDWLQTVVETYLAQNPDLIIMPVDMESKNSLFETFQKLDYLSLQMVTAGAFGIGKPIISSAANQAFRKKSFLEASQTISGGRFFSGDDVFLLHAFKQKSFHLVYLKSAQAMVKTTPSGNVKQFVEQRMRWGGKSLGYTDSFARNTAILVFLVNSVLAISAVLGLMVPGVWVVWIGAFLIKMFVDYALLKAGSHFFSVKLNPLLFVLFSLIYPFYVMIVGASGILFKERWKDRKGK